METEVCNPLTPALLLVDSPVLLMCLLLTAGLFAAALYRVQAQSRAPDFAGYNWRDHPRTLLACYRPDCGCGIGAAQWAMEGITYHLDVLVVSDKPTQELAGVQQQFPYAQIAARANVSPATISRLSPTGKTTALLVEDGRIVRMATGKIDFYTFTGR